MAKLKLNSEAISNVGCNIATGVVVEQFVDGKVKPKVYYLNAYTAYRNFVNCLDGNAADKINAIKNPSSKRELIKMFIEDTQILGNSLEGLGIEFVLYKPDYKKVLKHMVNVKLLDEFKGLRYTILKSQDEVLKELGNVVDISEPKKNIVLKHVKDMAVTTHIGLDLLSLVKYDDVMLMESHTGEMKKKNKWYTKYKKLPDLNMSIIPFNAALYYLLGDDNYVKPFNMVARRAVYNLILKTKWSNNTAQSRVLSGLTTLNAGFVDDIKKFVFRRLFD